MGCAARGVAGSQISPFNSAKVLAHANLVAYRKRIRDRWWKDLKDA